MDYRALARDYATQYGVNPDIFERQIYQESGFNPDATSPVGAMGLAQIMPGTARDPGYGVTPVSNPYDPEESLRFGAEYMAAMLDRYDGDYRLALAAYNAGVGRVEPGGTVPNIPETTNYVATILGSSARPGPAGAPLPDDYGEGQTRPRARPEDLDTTPPGPDPVQQMRAVYDMVYANEPTICPPGYAFDAASQSCVAIAIPRMSPPSRPQGNPLERFGGIRSLGG